jgi:MFS family permease
VAILGILAALTANWPLLLLAAFLIGVGDGPSPPAGSEILTRSTPRRHRSLIMSIKQSGVPLGGVIAGLLLPAVTVRAGWRMALLTAALLTLAAALTVQPWRKTLDAGRDSAKRLSLRAVFSHENLAAPFAVLQDIPGLLPLTVTGFSFACVQGCLLAFFVTQLTTELFFSLPAAGAAFAAMQVSGTFSRVIMGWLADRLGGRRTLLLLSFASALMIAALSRISAGWPAGIVALLALVVGVTSISWNGVHLAEVARTAPAGRVGDATAGVVFFSFAAYAIAPVIFAVLVPRTGSYGTCFLGLAGIALIPAPLLWRLIRQRGNG